MISENHNFSLYAFTAKILSRIQKKVQRKKSTNQSFEIKYYNIISEKIRFICLNESGSIP